MSGLVLILAQSMMDLCPGAMSKGGTKLQLDFLNENYEHLVL